MGTPGDSERPQPARGDEREESVPQERRPEHAGALAWQETRPRWTGGQVRFWDPGPPGPSSGLPRAQSRMGALSRGSRLGIRDDGRPDPCQCRVLDRVETGPELTAGPRNTRDWGSSMSVREVGLGNELTGEGPANLLMSATRRGNTAAGGTWARYRGDRPPSSSPAGGSRSSFSRPSSSSSLLPRSSGRDSAHRDGRRDA